ncbi:MAG: hypothetical protein AVDCRST_MAG85-1231, partial [uncultured Solirubrobacteraceae bacterium]
REVVAGPAAKTRGAAASVRDSVLRIRRGRVRATVSCTATTPCRGTLRLKTRGARPVVLGSARVAIAAGRTATVEAKLSAAGRRVAARKAKTPATVEIDLGAAGRATKAVTVRR